MPNKIETSIDELFSEHYGLDDCMDIAKILCNRSLNLEKDINLDNSKEEIRHHKIFNIHLSHNGTYIGHYRMHSETAIEILDFFIKNPVEKGEKEYLENKIVNFFKSYEWETWSYRNAENEGAEF